MYRTRSYSIYTKRRNLVSCGKSSSEVTKNLRGTAKPKQIPSHLRGVSKRERFGFRRFKLKRGPRWVLQTKCEVELWPLASAAESALPALTDRKKERGSVQCAWNEISPSVNYSGPRVAY
ncbi:unnamed protein product, partial [Iphiclides podalirius]